MGIWKMLYFHTSSAPKHGDVGKAVYSTQESIIDLIKEMPGVWKDQDARE